MAFCVTYVWLTPHREFQLIVHEHNASAAIALGGSLIGFAIALAGAIHNTQAPLEFVAWGFVAFAVQVLAYRRAFLFCLAYLNSINTPSAPSAVCNPSRLALNFMVTPFPFVSHIVPRPRSAIAQPRRT